MIQSLNAIYPYNKNYCLPEHFAYFPIIWSSYKAKIFQSDSLIDMCRVDGRLLCKVEVYIADGIFTGTGMNESQYYVYKNHR